MAGVQRPQFTPRATPVSTVARPGMWVEEERQAAPARPRAPEAPTMPRAPARTNGIMEFAEALRTVNPALDRAFTRYARETAQEDAQRADIRALQDNAKSWAEAVQRDPKLADESPWFRRFYEDRLARTTMQRKSAELMKEYYGSDIATSTDPGAINSWLMERMGDTLQQLDNETQRSAAVEELKTIASQLHQRHTETAVQNLVQANLDSVSENLSAIIDNHISVNGGAVDVPALIGALHAEESAARAQGIGGKDLNRLVVDVFSTKMEQHGLDDLAAVIEAPRPDGQAGAGKTRDGIKLIQAARDAIFSKAVQSENLRWQRWQREREMQEISAVRSAMGIMLDQITNGQTPALSPDVLAEVAQANPEAAARMLSVQGQLQSYDQTEDPVAVSSFLAEVYSGEASILDVERAVRSGTLRDPTTIRNAYDEAGRNKDNTVLSDPVVKDALRDIEELVGEPIEQGVLANPDKANEAMRLLRLDIMEWAENNPGYTKMDLVKRTDETSLQLIDRYRPSAWMNRPAEVERRKQELIRASYAGREPNQTELEGLRKEAADPVIRRAFDQTFGPGAADYYLTLNPPQQKKGK